MKRKVVCTMAAIVFLLFTAGLVTAVDDIKEFPSCKYCGMDRAKFNFSRVYIEYGDGAQGFCSLHCAAVDLAVHIDRSPKVISVADYDTKQLVDAEKALWVIGGTKQGVMSRRAKWAFASADGRDRFIKEFSGTPASFEEAIKASYEDMYQDTKMIRDRRAMMRKKAAEMKQEMKH